LIEGRQLDLPKDYAKKSKEYMKTFEDGKDNEVLTKWQDDLKKKTTPEILDPALAAYNIQKTQLTTAQGEARTNAVNEAIGKYNEALEFASPVETSTIQYQLSQLYHEAGQPEKQLEALKAASENRDAKQAKIEYARALREAKKPDEALVQLTELSKHLTEAPAQPSMFGGNPDDSIRFLIAGEFDALGKKDLAAAERAQVKPPSGAPGGMNFGNMGGLPGGLKIGKPTTVKSGKAGGGKSGPTINLGNVSTGGSKTITIPAPKTKP
jgi:tetratricopeptide (TPR) repeat protein